MTQELFIPQISRNTRHWRACILIEEKGLPLECGKGHLLQKLILTDAQGNKVQGLIWNDDINALQDLIEPCKTYLIGGAVVQEINPAYQAAAFGLRIQWTIKRSSFILPITDKIKEIPYPPINVLSYNDLIPCIHNDTRVDMLAVVVEVKAPRDMPLKSGPSELQELTIVHQEMKPLMLTLWGKFVSYQGNKITAVRDTMPIILCKRLKVRSFGVLSLATNTSSYVEVNPDIAQARELRNWANNNINAIRKVLNQAIEEVPNPAVTYNPKQEVLPVAHLPAESKSAWVKVKITLPIVQEDLCFMTCPECTYLTSAIQEESFLCINCKTFQLPAPRCKLCVELHDYSGTIKANVYDKAAEKILSYTALDISTMGEEEIKSLLIAADSQFNDEEFIVELKTGSHKTPLGKAKHTVQKWFPKDDIPKGEESIIRALPPPTTALSKTKRNSTSPCQSRAGPSTSKASVNSASDEADSQLRDMKKMDLEAEDSFTSSDQTPRSSFKKMKLESNKE